MVPHSSEASIGDPDAQLRHDLERELRVIEEERRHIVYVCDTPVGAEDYPPCLDRTDFDCESCSFIFRDPHRSGCYLRHNHDERKNIWEILGPWAEALRRRRLLLEAIEKELGAHGRELHYAVLTRMLQERHPALTPTEGAVLHALFRSRSFVCVSPGVYRLARQTSNKG